MRNGRPTKAESTLVDWGAVQQRVVSGESLSSIAKDFPVTRQAISLRAAREGWLAPQRSADVSADPAEGNIRWLDLVSGTEMAKKPWDPAHPTSFRPEIFAAFLADLSRGSSISTAADLHAISQNQLFRWRDQDRVLDGLVRAAIARSRKSLTDKIASAGKLDWRANAWLLERLPQHKEEFVPAQQAQLGTGGITVNISVARDEQVAIAGGVKMIDVTPEKP